MQKISVCPEFKLASYDLSELPNTELCIVPYKIVCDGNYWECSLGLGINLDSSRKAVKNLAIAEVKKCNAVSTQPTN